MTDIQIFVGALKWLGMDLELTTDDLKKLKQNLYCTKYVVIKIFCNWLVVCFFPSNKWVLIVIIWFIYKMFGR